MRYSVILQLMTYALLSLSLLTSYSSQASEISTKPRAYQAAPTFSLPGDKFTVNLAAYRGRAVYLDFWASWCVPCRKSFPWMNEMKERYARKGLSIIAINLDDSQEAAKDFLSKVPAQFTIVYDPQGKVAEAYNLKVMPSSFLIDRHGRIISQHAGFQTKSKDEMEKQIQQLLTIK